LEGPLESFWERDPNPDCRQKPLSTGFGVVQRDFIALEEKNQTQLLTPYWIDDGLFNFMRWFLPRRMLEKEAFLLHSAAVLDEKGRAYLCLGPSGAGKTTISSMAPEGRVLGDDMNVIVGRDGQWFVTSAMMGQRMDNPRLFGQFFPVHRVFWLKKGESTRFSNIGCATSLVKVLSQMANLFWPDMETALSEKANNFASSFAEAHPLKQLTFNLNGEVWKDVFDHENETHA
jgi:hypothetical protein